MVFLSTLIAQLSGRACIPNEKSFACKTSNAKANVASQEAGVTRQDCAKASQSKALAKWFFQVSTVKKGL